MAMTLKRGGVLVEQHTFTQFSATLKFSHNCLESNAYYVLLVVCPYVRSTIRIPSTASQITYMQVIIFLANVNSLSFWGVGWGSEPVLIVILQTYIQWKSHIMNLQQHKTVHVYFSQNQEIKSFHITIIRLKNMRGYKNCYRIIQKFQQYLSSENILFFVSIFQKVNIICLERIVRYVSGGCCMQWTCLWLY